jgi:adenylate kinase
MASVQRAGWLSLFLSVHANMKSSNSRPRMENRGRYKDLKVVLFGPPGCGKGTQSKLLSDAFGLQHISSGELIREETEKGTELGKAAGARMHSGEFVPDDIINKIVLDRLNGLSGYIIDGYPRTVPQAELLGDSIDIAFCILVEEDVCMQRILERGQGRTDDNEEVAKRRWLIYLKETRPVVGFYEGQGKLVRIEGDRPKKEVFESIRSAMDRYMDKNK